MKQIAVLGLGRFGQALATKLMMLGHEVMGVDRCEEIVNAMAPCLTNCLQADIRDEKALQALGLRNFDTVVVCTGELQASIVTVMQLKEMDVNKVVCKVNSDMSAKILLRLGADKVIFPERDMGARLARSIANADIVDYFTLSDTHGMLELTTPRTWAGKSIRQVDARAKYGITIVAISHVGQMRVSPSPDEVLNAGDILVVIGSNEQMDALSEL
jgi:trk system potassium uptake protein TrkA